MASLAAHNKTNGTEFPTERPIAPDRLLSQRNRKAQRGNSGIVPVLLRDPAEAQAPAPAAEWPAQSRASSAGDAETLRLDALHRLNLLDTIPAESFDRITRMAARLFGLPVAAVSLTDRDRQWFKSSVGVEHRSIPRNGAPCAAVALAGRLLVLEDLPADPAYADSVLARQGIRFYAGAPLVTRGGLFDPGIPTDGRRQQSGRNRTA